MLPAVDFKDVALTIPVVRALALQNRVQRVKNKLEQLSMDILGGTTAPSEDIPLSVLKDTISNEIMTRLHDAVGEIQLDPAAYSCDVTVCCDLFADKPEPPSILLSLQIDYIFDIDLAFLAAMRHERPAAYNLIRSIFVLIKQEFPVTGMVEASEMALEDLKWQYEEMKEQGEDVDETYPLEAAKSEIKEYLKHFKRQKSSLRKVQALYKRSSWQLTSDERVWVETAIELFKTLQCKQRGDIQFVDLPTDQERHDVCAFFYLFWGHGAISEYFYNMFQYDFGNTMPPCVRISILDAASLKNALMFLKSWFLLMNLFSGGYQLWN